MIHLSLSPGVLKCAWQIMSTLSPVLKGYGGTMYRNGLHVIYHKVRILLFLIYNYFLIHFVRFKVKKEISTLEDQFNIYSHSITAFIGEQCNSLTLHHNPSTIIEAMQGKTM